MGNEYSGYEVVACNEHPIHGGVAVLLALLHATQKVMQNANNLSCFLSVCCCFFTLVHPSPISTACRICGSVVCPF